MFERFTIGARNAVMDAQNEAIQAGARRIDSTHLVPPLLRAPAVRGALTAIGTDVTAVEAAIAADVHGGELDSEALAAVGIDLAEVSRRADELFGPDSLHGRRPRQRHISHIPFGKDAKKVLELGLREAIRLRQRSISERHLLLGMLRADCPGRLLLAEHVDVAALRDALEIPHAQSA